MVIRLVVRIEDRLEIYKGLTVTLKRYSGRTGDSHNEKFDNDRVIVAVMCKVRDLNPRPIDPKSIALPLS